MTIPFVNDEETLVFRLRKRAEVRRHIRAKYAVRKNEEEKLDAMADLLEEAANLIEKKEQEIDSERTKALLLVRDIDELKEALAGERAHNERLKADAKDISERLEKAVALSRRLERMMS